MGFIMLSFIHSKSKKGTFTRETVPSKTSDMGKKIVSVLAH